jgi:hypothetical protein
MSKEINKSKYFTPIGDGMWQLKHDLTINTGPFSQSTLRKGFITNFASIPWPFTKLIDPDDDDIALPAAFHDAWVGEFSQFTTIIHRPISPTVPQLETLPDWARAANELKKLMYGFRASPWKRFLAYWAVRVYGMYKDRRY